MIRYANRYSAIGCVRLLFNHPQVRGHSRAAVKTLIETRKEEKDRNINKSDPLFGRIGKRINPAIWRAFKESRSLKYNDKVLMSAIVSTDKALSCANQRLSASIVDSPQDSYLYKPILTVPPNIPWARLSEATLNYGDQEFKGIVSILAINMPKLPNIWLKFDTLISDRFVVKPNVEWALLFSYAMHSTQLSYPKLHIGRLTPMNLLHYISVYKRRHPLLNVYEELIPVKAADDLSTRSNKTVESLGLLLHLFANHKSIVGK